jgi:hypothetical protein
VPPGSGHQQPGDLGCRPAVTTGRGPHSARFKSSSWAMAASVVLPARRISAITARVVGVRLGCLFGPGCTGASRRLDAASRAELPAAALGCREGR